MSEMAPEGGGMGGMLHRIPPMVWIAGAGILTYFLFFRGAGGGGGTPPGSASTTTAGNVTLSPGNLTVNAPGPASPTKKPKPKGKGTKPPHGKKPRHKTPNPQPAPRHPRRSVTVAASVPFNAGPTGAPTGSVGPARRPARRIVSHPVKHAPGAATPFNPPRILPRYPGGIMRHRVVEQARIRAGRPAY